MYFKVYCLIKRVKQYSNKLTTLSDYINKLKINVKVRLESKVSINFN